MGKGASTLGAPAVMERLQKACRQRRAPVQLRGPGEEHIEGSRVFFCGNPTTLAAASSQSWGSSAVE